MDKTIVFKCGGSVIRELSDTFYENVRSLQAAGFKLAIVHGGGPEITNMLQKLNVKTEFVDGQRKTTKPVLEVAEMVLSGMVNKYFVSELAKHDILSVGVSGKDGQMLVADFLDQDVYGYVGEIKEVHPEMAEALMEKQFIPVIAPLSMTEECQTLNVNADLAASAVAGAMKADKLMFVTDVEGILKNGELLDVVTEQEALTLIDEGIISGGMIPKVQSALSALSGDVDEVMIVNGKGSIFTGETFKGTRIVKEKEAVL
ncbi:acetylglutamate kinase [Bacillus pumilus]|uniref:acetylglutamate kinase n=1 Tax=Bacillus pumilus TaxID=1408 RepID=UPI00119F8479|nr:acetylglutamate kinase [Bacillus pumilus]